MQKKQPTSNGATKTDLKSLEKALKSDLKKTEKSLRTELLRLEGKMEEMEERTDENAKKYRDQVLNNSEIA